MDAAVDAAVEPSVVSTAESAEHSELVTLREQVRVLTNANAQMQSINTALMDRVERDMDSLGSSFSLFQSAIVLESKVKERTGALTQVLGRLERANRELVLSSEAAVEASRAKSVFLATMSHELRTPMHGVLGVTELLSETLLTEEQREYTSTIKRSAESLLTILNDILDFSKIEAGYMITESTSFEPRRTAESSVKLLMPLIARKGLRISSDWADAFPTKVIGDPTRFQQIITNLLGNAVKFTESGSISLRATVVRTDSDTALLRFEVEDTGVGIDRDHQISIFDPFAQSDSSIARHFGGTGLGLAIVRRLSELMGGSCGVESELGRGSTFWFSIECRIDKDALCAPNPTPPFVDRITTDTPTTHVRWNVLVVEDNPVNQLVARRSLEALNCRVAVANSGSVAVAILTASHDFDLVLMDCQMPGMDGLEATRLIREHEGDTSARLPIVALTANAMAGDREHCLAAGMDDFVSKPFKRADLQATLDRWCTADPASRRAPPTTGARE